MVALLQPAVAGWDQLVGLLLAAVLYDPCCRAAQSPYRHWFLTHFHADHYKGLNGK